MAAKISTPGEALKALTAMKPETRHNIRYTVYNKDFRIEPPKCVTVPWATLDDRTLDACRFLYTVAGVKQTALATAFGLSQSHMSRVVRGLRYTHGHSPYVAPTKYHRPRRRAEAAQETQEPQTANV